MAAIDFPPPVEGLKYLSWIYTNGAWVKQTVDLTFILASSGNWESTYTTVDTESANWNSTYNTVTSLSDTWDDQFDSTELEAASGNWNSTYTTVTNESADWGIDTIYDDSLLQATSGNWDSTYTTVSSNSASWSNSQQTITSSTGTLTLDVSLGQSATTTLTEDITTFTIQNASAGDSGVLIISSDGGGWTFPDQNSLGASHIIHTGSPNSISTLTSTTSSAVSIGWYCDGSRQFLYISDPT